MCIIENDTANLKDMFTGYLTRSSNMFDGREMADSKKMLNHMGEIEKLRAVDERLRELNARLAELENRIAISDEIANSKLMGETMEMKEIEETLEKNTDLRNRLRGG